MSSSKIRQGCTSLFLQGNITADDSFQVPVIRAQKQRALFAQRFGAPTKQALANSNRYIASDCIAMSFPFIGDLRELAAHNSPVISIQLAQDLSRQFRSANRSA